MKARAASGSRNPAMHGSLTLADPQDQQALTAHCTALGRTDGTGDASNLLGPAQDLLPDVLHTLRDPAFPYSCFIRPLTQAPNTPGTLALCFSDSRLPHHINFTWADLQTKPVDTSHTPGTRGGDRGALLPLVPRNTYRLRGSYYRLPQYQRPYGGQAHGTPHAPGAGSHRHLHLGRRTM